MKKFWAIFPTSNHHEKLGFEPITCDFGDIKNVPSY